MASMRTRTMLCRSAHPVPVTMRRQLPVWSFQRRSIASHIDATYPQVPYEKAEKVGDKRFSQFDFEGKVFVVTGVTPRPLRTL
jgi:hypothetical protein